mgnify:CR=1 FL=1
MIKKQSLTGKSLNSTWLQRIINFIVEGYNISCDFVIFLRQKTHAVITMRKTICCLLFSLQHL